MSHLLIAADRRAHIRIVGVSLAAALVFVAALLAARVGDPMSDRLVANAPTVLKAEKATIWSSREAGAVR